MASKVQEIRFGGSTYILHWRDSKYRYAEFMVKHIGEGFDRSKDLLKVLDLWKKSDGQYADLTFDQFIRYMGF